MMTRLSAGEGSPSADTLRGAGTIEYTGKAFGHEYSVTAKHAPWRTSVTDVAIDGVEYPLGRKIPDSDENKSDVEVRASGLLKVRLKVRRRNADGSMEDKEEIHVSSAFAGRAGEAEVRKNLDIVPLLPEAGSRSEVRERKRAAHPERYALASGLTRLVRLLIPFMGLGALFAWLFDPIAQWLKENVWPRFAPIAHWLQAVLTPVGEFFAWLFNLLFGWIPGISVGIPDWVSTTLRIALLVLVAYFASRSNLNRRKKKLEESQSARDSDNDEDVGPADSASDQRDSDSD
ncbi:hypothetical protein [Brevibacterium sp. JSBI002]|uniref:hypothetical protein n=1 Tax=Brevibacterium sp. JSBI002 TaxID=2886045 RepID=UPI002230840E|nr:hypothetical protein [Brevibacterium sp. JSBI002]UZD61149.1 hypothetical protein LJ362_10635 [Brevibacterium sp. JSBI002]